MAGSLMLSLYSFFMKRIQSITPSMDWPPTSRNHAIPQTTFSVRSHYLHCPSCLWCESITWMEMVKKESLIINHFSYLSFLFAFLLGYGVEHAQCVPPSEYSEPGFITESYQTLHPISSEELLTLKTENEYPAVILRDTPLNPLQGDYFSVKQEVVSPDNMCVGRLSRGEGVKKKIYILRTELCLWLQCVS